MTNPKHDVDEAAMREVLASVYEETYCGVKGGADNIRNGSNPSIPVSCVLAAMRRISAPDLQRENDAARSHIAHIECENEGLREALERIEGGSYDFASEYAINGQWHVMYGKLQEIARAALNPASDG